jgi:hypothetical protein
VDSIAIFDREHCNLLAIFGQCTIMLLLANGCSDMPYEYGAGHHLVARP